MTTELSITEADMALLREQLLGADIERCAVLFATHSQRRDGSRRLLVREAVFPDATDYTTQGPIEAQLSPLFVAKVTKRAAKDKLALVFVHTHLDSGVPRLDRKSVV